MLHENNGAAGRQVVVVNSKHLLPRTTTTYHSTADCYRLLLPLTAGRAAGSYLKMVAAAAESGDLLLQVGSRSSKR